MVFEVGVGEVDHEVVERGLLVLFFQGDPDGAPACIGFGFEGFVSGFVGIDTDGADRLDGVTEARGEGHDDWGGGEASGGACGVLVEVDGAEETEMAELAPLGVEF